MPKEIDRLSTDDLLIPVSLLVTEGANADPTQDLLWFAFVIGGLPPRQRPEPYPTGWTEGFWLQSEGQNLAGILIGPGGVELAPGRWAAWLRIQDNPTAPVWPVDEVIVL